MRFYIKIVVFFFLFVECKKTTDHQSSTPSQAPRPSSAEAIIIKGEQLDENLRVAGVLLAAEQVIIHPEISGKVTQIFFKDGQVVNKNQLLLKLNDEDLIAKLNKLKIQEELLHINEQRQSELLKVKAIGNAEYENSSLQYKNILSDINILKTDLKKYYIRAPFNGTLGFRNISPGDFINSSTNITTLTQVHPLKLKFSVSEQYINRVQVKQKILFSCDNQNTTYSATINSLSPFLNEESKNLEILALVDHSPKTLRPGLFATVQFNISKKSKSIMVPSQCIIPRIKDKQVALYKSGKVMFSIVEIGFRDSSRVEILSGIQIGDTILTTGLMKVKEGTSINLINLNTK
ncbi:MAG: efflux RND transporter periplasmic adaptor subunit [Saprospiraceae bacterium]